MSRTDENFRRPSNQANFPSFRYALTWAHVKGFIGFIACDSRTTKPDGRVDDDLRKLHAIKFADGNSAIVDESGLAESSSRVIEIMTSRKVFTHAQFVLSHGIACLV